MQAIAPYTIYTASIALGYEKKKRVLDSGRRAHKVRDAKGLVAPYENRTHGKCLEGIYVTTTPMVLLLPHWSQL